MRLDVRKNGHVASGQWSEAGFLIGSALKDLSPMRRRRRDGRLGRFRYLLAVEWGWPSRRQPYGGDYQYGNASGSFAPHKHIRLSSGPQFILPHDSQRTMTGLIRFFVQTLVYPCLASDPS